MKIKRLFSLFWTFFRIGAFTFGGGFAMIPLIQREVVEKRKWITDEDILDIVAIAESTPGPIAINAATFVGFRVGGFFGALFATVGMVLPSFCIIIAISALLERFNEVRAVKYAFFGIRAGVLALIIKALWTLKDKAPKGIFSYLLMALAFVFATFFKVNVLYIIAGCAVVGLVSALLSERRAGK